MGVIDLLPQLPLSVLRDDTGMMFQSMGDWFSTYQRVTHYFRALDIWQPPPHLLALAVLHRAVSKADGARSVTAMRLAMDEVHSLLGQQASIPREAGAGQDLFGSVCWRVGAWLTDGGRRDVLGDVGAAGRLRPVPPAVPGPMVPQPLEAPPLAQAVRALTAGIRLRLGGGWRRRHA